MPLHLPSAPRRSARRTATGLAIVLGVAALTACGGGGEGAPSTAPTTPAVTSEEPTTASPRPTLAPTPTPASTPDTTYAVDALAFPDDVGLGNVDEALLQGPRTVALVAERRAQPGDSNPLSSSIALRIYGDTPAVGSALISAESPRELLGYTTAAQQDATAPAGVLVVTRERLAASGLVSGGVALVLRTVDSSGSVTSTASVPASESTNVRNLSWSGTTMFARLSEGGLDGALGTEPVIAVDTAGGAVLWTRDCADILTGAEGPLVPSPGGPVVTDCGSERVGLDPASGAVVWTTPTEGPFNGVEPIPGAPAFAHVDEQVIALATGAVVTGGGTSRTADPITGLLALTHCTDCLSTSGEQPGLLVLDTATGAPVLEVPAADIEALSGFEPLGAYDGRLWFWGPNGVDVVDLRTGAQDTSLSPPVATGQRGSTNVVTGAGDTWVVLSDVDLYGDATLATVVRSSDGPVPVAELPATTRS